MAIGAILGQRSGIQTISGQHPDPNGNINALLTSGGTMQGNLNMDNNKITGLPFPTADNEPETMGHAKQTYVEKANIVNNFVTNNPGFVADARTVSELNKKFSSASTKNVTLLNTLNQVVASLLITKINNLAFVNVVGHNIALNTETELQTILPLIYRPYYKDFNITAVICNKENSGYIKIYGDGKIKMLMPGTYMQGSTAYVTE